MINDKLRRKAVKIAKQLPKDRNDAEVVVGLLGDLVDWIHPVETRRDALDLVSSETLRSSSDLRANGSADGSPR